MTTTCRESEGGKPLCKLGELARRVEFRGRSLYSIDKSTKSSPHTELDEANKQYDLCIIAESPTRYNEFSGFTGKERTTEKIIDFCNRAGIDLRTVWYTYGTRCAPPKGRKPSVQETSTCLPYLHNEIDRIQPKVIMTLGSGTLRLFKLQGEGGVNAIHGKVYDREILEKTYKVISTFDPNIVFHKPDPKLESRIVDDYKRAKRVIDGGRVSNGTYQSDYYLVDTIEKVDALVEKLKEKRFFAFDTESRALPWTREPLLCFSFCWGYGNDEVETCILPIYKSIFDTIDDLNKAVVEKSPLLKDKSAHTLTPFWQIEKTEEALKNNWEDLLEIVNNSGPNLIFNKLRPVFEDPTIAKSAHNIKYDMNVLRKHANIKIKGFLYDSMLMHHALNEYGPHKLEYLADVELGVGDWSKILKDIVGHGKQLKYTYDRAPNQILWPYAATDAESCYRLTRIYYNELKRKPHLWKLYCEDYEKTTKTLASAEWHGHAINSDTVAKVEKQFKDKQNQLLVEIEKPTWPGFKPSSPDDVNKALTKMGFGDRIKDKRKAKGYNTGKDVLGELKKELPLAGYILQYRNTVKMIGTYIDNLKEDLDSDGRIRYSWFIHGTDSGRLSCRFFHQIPRINNRLKYNLRDMFVAGPERKLIYFDYCLDPDTPILKEDLTWEPIKNLKVGDVLIGVDENKPEKGKTRKIRKTKVLRTFESRKACYKITFSDGREVISSSEHPWLIKRQLARKNIKTNVKSYSNTSWKWKKTKDITCDDIVADVGKPWETDYSYEAGYLSGLFDGEGWLSHQYNIGFGQKDGIVYDTTKQYLKNKGFTFGETKTTKTQVNKLWMSSKDGLRFLGSIRPQRLIKQRDNYWIGKGLPIRKNDYIKVSKIEFLGERNTINIETETHTFIANGFVTHNSQLELRIFAILAQEEEMLKCLYPELYGIPKDKAVDIHCQTAEQILGFKVTKSEEDKVNRQVGKDCYSGDTEVLTKEGWKQLRNFTSKDYVMQYHPQANNLSFTAPLARIEKDTNELWYLKDRNTDLAITPGHKQILYSRSRKPDHVKQIKEFTPNQLDSLLVPHGGFLERNWTISEDLTRVLVMVQADGSYEKYAIRLGFKKERKIQRARKLLNNVGIEYKESKNKDVTKFYITNYDGKEILSLLPEKKFTLDLINHCNPDIFIDELQHWDSTVITKGRGLFHYFTVDKQNADVVQLMAVTSGRKCNIKFDYNGKKKNGKDKYIWKVSTSTEQRPLGRISWNKNGIVKEKKNQKVYCLTVPSGFLLTRRNGKVTVSGNCNFAIIYGSEGYQLLQKSVWRDKEGNLWPLDKTMLLEGMKNFREKYKQADVYLSSVPEVARSSGNLYTTPFGRELRIGPDLTHEDEPIRKHAERKLVNATVQSPAGDLTKRTLNLIDSYLVQYIEHGDLSEDDVFLVNTVHDSGVFECKKEVAPWFTNVLKTTAERNVPELSNYYFKANIGVGETWSEAEKDAG